MINDIESKTLSAHFHEICSCLNDRGSHYIRVDCHSDSLVVKVCNRIGKIIIIDLEGGLDLNISEAIRICNIHNNLEWERGEK